MKNKPIHRIECCDCLDGLRGLDSDSVDLIVSDPPYFGVKAERWDNAWSSSAEFLEWLGRVLDEFKRVLKPQGSLYIFASPQMSSKVEAAVRDRLDVLNHIVWSKPSGKFLGAQRNRARVYFPRTERIIFAGQYGAEREYSAVLNTRRSALMGPLVGYLKHELQRSGLSVRDICNALGEKHGKKSNSGASHWFTASQFVLPSEHNWCWLRNHMNKAKPGAKLLAKSKSDFDYEGLQQRANTETAGQRRTFTMDKVKYHTDVWEFPVVQAYPGKHPCEKPSAMMEHIIDTSSKPGDVVLDAFVGSGASAIAALKLGREFIGFDSDPAWVERATQSIEGLGQSVHR